MLVDLLHLSRSLRRSPASAGAAILTLTVTLGAGASIFAVVDAVLLTPPPFADADALVRIGEAPIDGPAAAPRTVDYATFEAWRERAGSLATLEASDSINLTLTGLEAAQRLSGSNVTPGFLTLLGVTPAVGRPFSPADAGQRVVMVSHALWRGRLDGDPGVLGRQVVLGDQPHTIVGVLPERFFHALQRDDFWRPFPVTPAQAVRAGYRVSVVARLAGTVAPAHLERALDEVSRASSPPARAFATSLSTAIAGGASRPLALLAGAAGLAVLIAFINLAGLLIVRSIDRRRELAVRSALGARHSEPARQLLLEAGALVALGTMGGVVLALWTTPAVGRLALEQFGGVANRDLAVSWRVVGVMVIVAGLCAAICGSLPALLTARGTAIDLLRRGATPAPRQLALRRVFVIGEVALAFVLLVSVTLLGRSLLSVLNVSPGFDPRGVLTLKVSLPAASYNPERVASFYSALQGSLEERLGHRSTAVVSEVPLDGGVGLSPVGVRPAHAGAEAVVRETGAAYFDVMRIPVVAGRPFDARDGTDAPPRVVISEGLTQSLFGSEPPVGRHLWVAGRASEAEIIGVVGDVKHRALDEALLPTVYLSALQAPSHSSIVVVRSAHPDTDVIAAVREAVARLDGDLPVYGVESMEDVVAASPGMAARRMLTATFTGFAGLALVLGAFGLFGVAAHDVASRRPELALRMALGADPGQILRATLGQGLLMVGAGLAVGGVLSIWVARGLNGIVFGTGDVDVLSVAIPAALLMAAGAAAVLPAALRAARTDPLIALRSE